MKKERRSPYWIFPVVIVLRSRGTETDWHAGYFQEAVVLPEQEREADRYPGYCQDAFFYLGHVSRSRLPLSYKSSCAERSGIDSLVKDAWQLIGVEISGAGRCKT